MLTVCKIVAQKTHKNFRVKQFILQKDTLLLDSVSINPYKFKVFSKNGKQIKPTDYIINYAKSKLIIKREKYPKITVEYYLYPEFITKVHSPFNKNLIVNKPISSEKLYSQTTNKKSAPKKLFDGLKTGGFIARGITSGNNQNTVTNSSLDLNIEGKLSDKIKIRANIFDTSFPLQQNGYSQNITDFDRIFIELFSKNWRVKGGDINLKNSKSHFLNFQKQITGLEIVANPNKKINVSASGAIVRGKFSSFAFTGKEGNQGPYKIVGEDNQLNQIIIAESDRVYVNGNLLQRGETKDYIIDYNLAEIRFNTTYPIKNDMRIKIEYQYSYRNYTRFITYESAKYKNDNFLIEGHFYSENDAKNQPIGQNITDEHKKILAKAGNDTSKMIAESAYESPYNKNRIQYKKTKTFFKHSTDKKQKLYNVAFTNVGANNGDYVIYKTTAAGVIYKYAGKNKGNFSPITRLIAPSKLQIAVIKSAYQPSKKTSVDAEIALSNNDENLLSAKDDEKNLQIATMLNLQQHLLKKSNLQLVSNINFKTIQEHFKTIQRFESVEFNRDWNLINPKGNQQQINAFITLKNQENHFFSYGFKQLSFSKNYNGNKHYIKSDFKFGKTDFSFSGSLLSNKSSFESGSFFRLQSKLIHSLQKSWLGGFINFETNKRNLIKKEELSKLSHRFKEYETFYGIGDSTKVFTKFGFQYRINDSIKNNMFTTINSRKTFYVNSQLIKNKTTNLSVFANYQFTNNKFKANEKALNTRIVYNQNFLNRFFVLQSTYETSSGNTAQQDFVYIKTEPGQGFYTWIDYNKDGIQQLNEFEIAKFKDQANYLRTALPNLKFIATQKAKLKQYFVINPQSWKQATGLKKIFSHFYNQTFLNIENEQEKLNSGLHFNPFYFNKKSMLGLAFNLKNNLYFNRALQHYSVVYSYGKSQLKKQYIIGNQENNSYIHQLEAEHKIFNFWLLGATLSVSKNSLITQNYANRNYTINAKKVEPKISFLYDKNHRFSVFYGFTQKENKLQGFEFLKQQKLGLDYFFISKRQNQVSANFNYFLNSFYGDANSPVSYELLEGLQPGKNYTWSVLFNQKINSFLALNINYLGRKNNSSKVIHTGTVQLKAIF